MTQMTQNIEKVYTEICPYAASGHCGIYNDWHRETRNNYIDVIRVTKFEPADIIDHVCVALESLQGAPTGSSASDRLERRVHDKEANCSHISLLQAANWG